MKLALELKLAASREYFFYSSKCLRLLKNWYIQKGPSGFIVWFNPFYVKQLCFSIMLSFIHVLTPILRKRKQSNDQLNIYNHL